MKPERIEGAPLSDFISVGSGPLLGCYLIAFTEHRKLRSRDNAGKVTGKEGREGKFEQDIEKLSQICHCQSEIGLTTALQVALSEGLSFPMKETVYLRNSTPVRAPQIVYFRSTPQKH